MLRMQSSCACRQRSNGHSSLRPLVLSLDIYCFEGWSLFLIQSRFRAMIWCKFKRHLHMCLFSEIYLSACQVAFVVWISCAFIRTPRLVVFDIRHITACLAAETIASLSAAIKRRAAHCSYHLMSRSMPLPCDLFSLLVSRIRPLKCQGEIFPLLAASHRAHSFYRCPQLLTRNIVQYWKMSVNMCGARRCNRHSFCSLCHWFVSHFVDVDVLSNLFTDAPPSLPCSRQVYFSLCLNAWTYYLM